MKLVFGTTNKAKINFMKKRTESLGIEILSLNDADAPSLDIEENGKSPLENAKIKAHAYYRALKMPVFSCDSGLYIDELDAARQPGLNIRGAGDQMNDEQVIAFYSSLAAEFGGRMTARYINAIYLVLNENQVYEHMDEDIASDKFFIVATPHEKRRQGFPLDSLSVQIQSGRYYHDLDGNKEKYRDVEDGFTSFFQRVLAEMRDNDAGA